MTITPGQVKAARELLGWSINELAVRVGVSVLTIAHFESSNGWATTVPFSKVRAALESAGVQFITGSIVLRKRGRVRNGECVPTKGYDIQLVIVALILAGLLALVLAERCLS